MPIYNNALAQRPANMLAYQDSIGPMPRNEYLGALADFLAQSYSPERTQQAQQLAGFFSVPAVSQTLDRLSYGEPLTTGAGGLGGTTRIRPEALDAAIAVAPMAKPVTMASLQAARAARQAALATGQFVAPKVGQLAEGYMQRIGAMPGIMPPNTYIGQQIPSKTIKRFDDGGLEVGYKRGDSEILVSLAPTSKNNRMLSASLENIGGYPSGTGDATMAYVDAFESAVKNKFGKPVYWDGFTSESIQSNQARAIYDRLKAAGIPFEKNVFNDQNKNALSLTQQQLLDIDFDKVRSNLIKSAANKK